MMKVLLKPVRALTGAALLLAGTASVPAAHAATAMDLGTAPGGTVLSARVTLPFANQAAVNEALKARYTYGNPLFHHWMSSAEISALGPKSADVAAVKAALAKAGLVVTGTSKTGTVSVSGTAAAMQRAFGTSIHTMSRNGVRSFAAAGGFHPQGALAGRISGISGLTVGEMQPMLAHQRNADGSIVAGIPVPAAGSNAASPLDSYTNKCFTNGNSTVSLSSGSTSATYSGIGYQLDGKSCGYTPQQIAKHYGLDKAYGYGIDGRGQTIVIVDAYGSPTAEADAATFFNAVGIAPFTDDNFQIIYPAAQPTTTSANWALETELDIEMAHAIAPGAKIVLAVSPTSSNADLQATVQYVIDNHVGNVVSNSYGQPESTSDAPTMAAWDKLSQEAALQGISLLFSTGDSGDYAAEYGATATSSPSDSSWATAVGGTAIDIPSGNGFAETGWGNDYSALSSANAPLAAPKPSGFLFGGGGGVSTVIAKPFWQSDLPGNYRLEPDIGLIGDPFTGAIIVEPQANGPSVFAVLGGTSLAAPVLAAMWSMVNEASGWSPAAGQITPGSSFGVPGPQLKTFQSYLLTDALPLTAPSPVAISITTTSNGTPTTTTYDGFSALGIASNPGAITVLRRSVVSKSYSVLSFNTDSSLTTTTGYDNTTGRGVPNGAGAVALAAMLFGH
ncbi:S53 family peptidase [Acetobacteraceae bacterium KSS8]|uniref:S53 family peptidase n=1 Tax=Endosaccharibacter trunci TaxID=2812733 RepID=A0ABT1W6S6_9PROT|nr:S53 family peptidase [Acetobacteraceae bacterium KSS8]